MSQFLAKRHGRVSLLMLSVLCTCLIVPCVVAYSCNPETCLNGCCGDACLESGQGCCDGSVYDLSTEACCSGMVYDVSTQGCCDGQVFDGETESCCAGTTVYTIADEYCCEECGCVYDLGDDPDGDQEDGDGGSEG